jgi:hypothetical protein
VAGDIPRGLDAGLPGAPDSGKMLPPSPDGSHVTTHDASHPHDSTTAIDVRKESSTPASEASAEAGHEASIDSGKDAVSDGAPKMDVRVDAPHEDASQLDGSESDTGVDAANPMDAAHEADAHDAAPSDSSTKDATGVDASPPPQTCAFGYTCGSATCGCHQDCDNGTTCGACQAPYQSCGGNTCGTDFSSTFSCGGCGLGNICGCGLSFKTPTCTLVGGTYQCGCS